MKPSIHVSVCAFAALSSSLVTGKITPEQVTQLPPPASHSVRFREEIKPILETSCTKCHGRGKSKGDFRIDTRETFLKGGESGPAVILGKSQESLLIELVMGFDPDTAMPQKGSKLTSAQIGLLRAWIDQGAPWDEGVSFGRIPPINLKPTAPILPVGSEAFASRNGIDMILESYAATHGIRPGSLVEDRVFARRVHLDVIGLLPTPEELIEFLEDRQPGKRVRLVRRLLADNQRYAGHWLTFWNDLLRNDYKGTGYIDNGRKQISSWLYEALATNKRYDQFVAELINPTPESEGFTKGIVWRGAVNASQVPPMQAAQNIAQVFMGVNLKCASCHDSFINDWTLADAYGLASVYADSELELVQCDKPTGHKAQVKFIYPELGGIDSTLSKAERSKRLAEIVTQRDNARLTRTIVNRLWAKFMGRGLVEPVDDMEQKAWNPELLDWLAADLAENHYNLKKTIERILTSDAYQMHAVPAREQDRDYVFRGPNVRRMSAEQYLDALASVTGAWQTQPAAQLDFYAGRLASEAPMPRAAWIWNDPNAAEKTAPGTIYFRKAISLVEAPTAASIVVACDNSFRLYLNGKEIGSGRDYTKPTLIDLRPHLAKGTNVFAIAAVNDPPEQSQRNAERSSPAGLLCSVKISGEQTEQSKTRRWEADFVSDASWQWSTNQARGWEKADVDVSDWPHAVLLGAPGMQPWDLEKRFVNAVSTAEQFGRTRAALVAADPLMVALGRPNREQVITTRASAATTLQGLELTNGQTLAESLKKGAEKLLETNFKSSHEIVTQVYERALGRKPTQSETKLAEGLVGSPAKRDGVEDLLWAIAMLPEFQLIF